MLFIIIIILLIIIMLLIIERKDIRFKAYISDKIYFAYTFIFIRALSHSLVFL